jgi:uncharacterized protein YndB with AHSA1/START domain
MSDPGCLDRRVRERQEIMGNASFTTSILVDQTPERVFDAIKDVPAWWMGSVEGRTDEVGAEFTYTYKTMHRSTQKVTELVPGKKVVWHVSGSHLDFVKDKTEWTGTEMVFDIRKAGEKTELRFTHAGLEPNAECYGACSRGWTQLIQDNLRKLIERSARS